MRGSDIAYTALEVVSPIPVHRGRKKLFTFDGWDGKWWRRIKVGRAVLAAGEYTAPLKISLAYQGAQLAIQTLRGE